MALPAMPRAAKIAKRSQGVIQRHSRATNTAKPLRLRCDSFFASSTSAATISATSSSKVVVVQPCFARALLGSPTSVSAAAGQVTRPMRIITDFTSQRRPNFSCAFTFPVHRLPAQLLRSELDKAAHVFLASVAITKSWFFSATSDTASPHSRGRGPSRAASQDCPCRGSHLGLHPPSQGHA